MDPFTWKDGERVVRFGRGTAATAGELIGDDYLLLSTERARGAVPAVETGARTVLEVPSGFVDELAADLLDEVRATGDASTWLVALGGGRVIDTTKALGAATGRPVAAIPTTLSAAEMTWLHRHARGVEPTPPFTRPRVVVNDPAVSASQPAKGLAASAANSLAHAVDANVSTLGSPVPRLAAGEAARLTATAYAGGGDEPDREALALAALLSGYAIDGAWYGLHHVLAQTLVRVAGVGHGPANAALLPHTIRALTRRGGDVLADPALAERLAAIAGATHLADLGVDDDALDRCADAAVKRPELAHTPPAADRDEIREIYAAAH